MTSTVHQIKGIFLEKRKSERKQIIVFVIKKKAHPWFFLSFFALISELTGIPEKIKFIKTRTFIFFGGT